MNASVYSFNKHSFSTCVGQALGDAEESSQMGRGEGQGKTHTITNDALCLLHWRQAPRTVLGAKRKK